MSGVTTFWNTLVTRCETITAGYLYNFVHRRFEQKRPKKEQQSRMSAVGI